MATPKHLSTKIKSVGKSVVRSPKSKLPDGRVAPGKGPAKGAPNAGRPPDEWRAELRAMASSAKVMEHVLGVLQEGPSHPYFDRALQYATDHGYGKPKQEVGLSGTVTLEHLLARSHEL